MSPTDFVSRLEQLQHERHSSIALMLAPRIVRMPDMMRRYDDPFFPFSKAIIAATRDVVCAVIFDFAAFLAIGAAGAVALERSVAYARSDVVTILHGPFSGPGYAELMEETAFGVDALTLTDSRYLSHYVQRADRSAFVVTTGEPRTFDAPDSGGFYWQESGQFTMMGSSSEVLQLMVTEEDILYTSAADDFAQRTRALVDTLRRQT